jgi:hypothetical protein
MSQPVLRVLAATLLLLAACGPGDNSGDDTPDPVDARTDGTSNPPIDAPNNPPIDAPMGGAIIGSACTGEGQGTCPTGYDCLNLQGASGSWCSKRCTGMSDQSCSVGHTGTGFPACFLRVTPAGGGTPQDYCALFCFDAPGAPTICPGGNTQCNNTCPTPLQCTADIMDQNNMVVARLCE